MARTLEQMNQDLLDADALGDKELTGRILKSIRAAEAAAKPAEPVGPPVPAAPVLPEKRKWYEAGPRAGDTDAGQAYTADPTLPTPAKPIDMSPLAVAKRQSVEDIALRTPDFGLPGLSGGEIPFIPKAVSRFMVGNTQQATDAALGGKQLGAKLFGSKETQARLAQEAKDKEYSDKILMDNSTAANLGKFAGRTALTAPLMTMSGAGVAGSKLLPSVLKSAGIGAGEGLFTPGEDYSPVTNALIGGAAGAAGDVVGRGVTRLLAPGLGAGDDVIKDQVKRLEEKGMPLLAKDITDSPAIHMISDVLEKVPFLGSNISKTEDAQKRLYTKLLTGAAGTPMEQVGAGAKESIKTLPNKMAKAIRDEGIDIPIPNVSAEAQAALDAARQTLALSGKTPGPMLPNIIKAAQAPKVPNLTAGQVAAGVIPPPPKIPTMTPNEFMTARASLSKAGHAATGAQEELAKAGQESLENAYRAHVGSQAGAPAGPFKFDYWKKIHGLSEDILKAADRKKTAPITPSRFAAQLSAAEREAPSTPINQLTMDMASRLRDAPGGDMRNAILGALTTAAIPGAAIYGRATDSPIAGTAGAGVPLSAMFLLGTESGRKYLGHQMSPAMKTLMQQLLTSGAISSATTK